MGEYATPEEEWHDFLSGTHPHLPVWNAELIRCPQFPTTLPTLDELIGRDGITEANVAAHLLGATREPTAAGHVFTLHAELEGRELAIFVTPP